MAKTTGSTEVDPSDASLAKTPCPRVMRDEVGDFTPLPHRHVALLFCDDVVHHQVCDIVAALLEDDALDFFIILEINAVEHRDSASGIECDSFHGITHSRRRAPGHARGERTHKVRRARLLREGHHVARYRGALHRARTSRSR